MGSQVEASDFEREKGDVVFSERPRYKFMEHLGRGGRHKALQE